MTGKEIDDAMLMAFVDGELDAETAERVANAVAADPALEERAEIFSRSRSATQAAFAPVLAAPVPDHLISAILGDEAPARRASNILSFPSRQALGSWMPSALAACLALAIGFGAGAWLVTDRAGPGLRPMLSDPALLTALAQQPSGEETVLDIDGNRARLRLTGSFAVPGGLCRSFHLSSAAESAEALACARGDDDYAVDLAVIRPATDGESFITASDAGSAAIDAYLDSRDAGAPLSPEEEGLRLRQAGGATAD